MDRHLPESVRDVTAQPWSLPDKIEALERREIERALEQTGNNKKAAARALGISRKGLIDRLKRLDMWEQYGRTGFDPRRDASPDDRAGSADRGR
jgi:DNA-binding NtrC family response regulator